MYNRYNQLSLPLRLEAHIPEHVVDQMNDVLVQNWHFLDDCSLRRGTCKIMNTFNIIDISDKMRTMHITRIMHTMNATLLA